MNKTGICRADVDEARGACTWKKKMKVCLGNKMHQMHVLELSEWNIFIKYQEKVRVCQVNIYVQIDVIYLEMATKYLIGKNDSLWGRITQLEKLIFI